MLLFLITMLSSVLAKTCPPTGWEACSTVWPPPSDGYCCSSGGWLGDTLAHCSHINALDECCVFEAGRLILLLDEGWHGRGPANGARASSRRRSLRVG